MKFGTRTSDRGEPTPGGSGVSGTVRVDRRTSAVLRRLKPGDIAVVDHLDLDRSSAEALVDHGVVAVVNASPFISGRYPNLGPEVLARAGVVLLDDVGAAGVARLKDGQRARLEDGALFVGSDRVLEGRTLSLADVQQAMDDAREGLSTQLQSFTHNTVEFLRREQDLLLHGRGFPELETELSGRPVVVVVRDFDYAADLRRLRRFLRERHPVLIAVDGGADVLLAAGRTPDLLVLGPAGLGSGDAATGTPVTDKALRRSKEVLVHTDESGRLVGSERLDRLGVRPHRVAATCTTEDVALLLADARNAELIVTVGTHATLDEFLDSRRTGLASTFLTRLRVGPRIVDAGSVPSLYAGQVRLWHLILILLVGLLAVAAAIATTPVGEEWAGDLIDRMRGLLP